LREEDFKPGTDGPETKKLVKRVLDRTEEHFRSGFPLADAVPKALGRGLRATFAGGLALIAKIRNMDYAVFGRRPRLNLWDKGRLALSAAFGSTPSERMDKL